MSAGCRTAQHGWIIGITAGGRAIRAVLGRKTTRTGVAEDFIKHMVGWGYESIQFFDQNNGATAFACFAEDHGHPSMPGRWMTEKMKEFVTRLKDAMVSMGEKEAILSVEACVNDHCLQLVSGNGCKSDPRRIL